MLLKIHCRSSQEVPHFLYLRNSVSKRTPGATEITLLRTQRNRTKEERRGFKRKTKTKNIIKSVFKHGHVCLQLILNNASLIKLILAFNHFISLIRLVENIKLSNYP